MARHTSEKTGVTPSGIYVAKWKDHHLVMDAPTLAEKKEMATALEFQEQRHNERAADIAAEAMESAKRGFFGKVLHGAIIFTFGMVPDAFDEVVDFFKSRKR